MNTIKIIKPSAEPDCSDPEKRYWESDIVEIDITEMCSECPFKSCNVVGLALPYKCHLPQKWAICPKSQPFMIGR